VVVKASATGPSFMEALDGYLRESPRTDRSTRALKAELRRFLVAIGGDRPVSSITKPDCLKYKDSLLKEDERGLHLATVSDRLTTLAGIFKWCESQGHIPENMNPARNLAPSAKSVRKVQKSRKLFTDAQLVMIFGSPKFKSLRTKHPAHYWVLLICLFSACRREEAAQLHMTDIREEDGIPYLLITEEEGTDKSVKTKTTRRLPVHESLITLGFMDYVQQVKTAGHTRLFYQVSKGRSTYADAAGKMFSRIVRGLGMTDPGLVLHSLRHLGSTKLAEAGCPPDIARILTGHSGNDVHDKVYVHRENVKLSVLRDGLNRLRYDEVVKVLK
jgi:integrase